MVLKMFARFLTLIMQNMWFISRSHIYLMDGQYLSHIYDSVFLNFYVWQAVYVCERNGSVLGYYTEY